MSLESGEHHDWAGYFVRTQELPVPERTQAFLSRLPLNAEILDFGCGTGRWARAFLRDRPDLSIDVVDQHAMSALHIGQGWKGRVYAVDFNEFTPEKPYDAIWAQDTLFFIPPEKLPAVFGRLCTGLKPGGLFNFTMVAPTQAAKAMHFHGMEKEAIEAMVEAAGLTDVAVICRPDTLYAQRIVPSFVVTARKP